MHYHPRLHVVLVHPEIPHNTGAVGRTCVAVAAKLWLVRPLGFRLDDYYLRRAGLDYWEHLEWEVVDDLPTLAERIPAALPGTAVERSGIDREPDAASGAPGASDDAPGAPDAASGPRRPWLFTRWGSRLYTDVQYQPADVLLFGAETAGLPPSLVEAYPDRALRIPVRPQVRSLNLSNAVAVVVYEALRQWQRESPADARPQ
jgi:tRNA (cytidine/uridine-2'-O-)-methyltransferase